MADQPVTREKLINADIDVDNLGKAVNELGIVNPRYGNPYKTAPQVIQDLEQKSNQALIQGQEKVNDLAEAINIALAAGAGAAGWTASLVVDGDKNQQQINSFNALYTFNTVNVLDYIPKSQHQFIKNNQLNLQDEVVVTAGINMAALYARTYLTNVQFIIPPGGYAVNDAILLDLPNDTDIQFLGTLSTTALAKPAVVIGSYDTNRFRYKLKNVAVVHRNASANISADTGRLSVGVLLLNIVASSGNISSSRWFANAVTMEGSQFNGGSSYNHIDLGYIKDNIVGVRLRQSSSGYCNENTFYGGSFGHSGSFPFTGSEVNIVIEQGDESQKLNNNLFFRPSLESNNAATKAAVLEGGSNQIYMPRIENSQAYTGFEIVFGTTTDNCSVFGLGFGLKNLSIVDNGIHNKYQTASTFYWAGDPVSTRAVMELKNRASNTGKVLSIINSSNAENLTILGSGQLISESHGYFLNGLRWRTSSGTKTDKGIFLGTADPNGVTVASPGSLFVNTSNSKVFTKKSGADNIGWIELIELRSGSSAARPSGLSAGYPYFDTTLNKPIWFNGTVWVDATGEII